jgi:hypothetical protein
MKYLKKFETLNLNESVIHSVNDIPDFNDHPKSYNCSYPMRDLIIDFVSGKYIVLASGDFDSLFSPKMFKTIEKLSDHLQTKKFFPSFSACKDKDGEWILIQSEDILKEMGLDDTYENIKLVYKRKSK